MTGSADQYFAIIPESILYADISHTAVRVYGVLRRHADKDDGTCHPGRSRIAKLARMSPSSVDRAIAELVGIRAIEVVHRPDPDNPKHLLSNQYRLLTPPAGDHTPPASDDTPLPLVTTPPPAGDEETIVKEPKSKNQTAFDTFWQTYPRRIARSKAQTSWNTNVRKKDIEPLMDGLNQWITQWRNEGMDTQYIPYPATWLNQKRWQDPPTPVKELRPYDQPKRRGCDNCDNTGYIHHEDNGVTWVTECECNQ